MSYSRRQLEALGEPFGNSATQKKLGGGYIAGFGGDSPQQQPSSTSTTTSNIPDWAIPYATKNLGLAEALTDKNANNYQTYQGNRVADFSDQQKQAYGDIAGMKPNAGVGDAMNQTQDAYNQSANAAPYNSQDFGNQYGSGPQFNQMGLGYLAANAPQLNNYQMGQADQVSGNNVNNQNINAAQSGYQANLNDYQMGPASQVRSQNFGQQSVQDYMSPYQQNVTDFQKDQAVLDYGRKLPGQNAQAVGAGAFGGSRQAIVSAEGQRNLQNQLGGIQAVGSQNAYQNAQQQFNADQARRMQAQMSNQQAGLTVGQQNLASRLQTQALGAGQDLQVAMSNLSNQQQSNVQNAANNLQAQGMNADQALRAALANQGANLTVGQQNLGANLQTQALGSGQSMQAQLANQGAYGQMQGLGMQQNLAGNQQAMQNAQLGAQYGLAGQQATEQSNQYGANYGLQNRQQALSAAQQLGALGQTQYGQQMGINQAQQLAGAQQQAQTQQGLNNLYQDFLNNQNNPYKQIGFMQDILRGTPTSGGAASVYQAPPNNMGMAIGLGTAALNAYGRAGGGIINAYKKGGIVRKFAEGGLTDPGTEMAAESKLPPRNTAEALAKFMLPMIQKMHQPKATPGNTTVAEDMAREILSRQQPEQDMRQSGIASLPAENLQEDSYQGGGIVAFQQGGDTENSFDSGQMQNLVNQIPPEAPQIDSSAAGKYTDLLKAEEDAKARYVPKTREEISKELMEDRARQGISGQIGDARQAQLEQDQSKESARKDDAGRNFFISAGLNMAAEASKRGNPLSGLASILQPASVGAQQAMPGYLAEQEKLRSLTEARNKEMSDIDNARRAEKSGLVTLTQSTMDKQDARVEKIDERILALRGKLADSASAREVAIAGKAPDAQEAYVRAYVNSELAKGSKVDPVILRAKGMEEYVKTNRSYQPSFAATEQRGVSADEEARIKREDQERKRQSDAGEAADKILANGVARTKVMDAIWLDEENAKSNQDKGTNLPTNNEETLRAKTKKEAYDRLGGGKLAPKSTAPAGASSTAKPYSVTAPNGTTFGFDTKEQAAAYRKAAGIK